MPTWSEQQLRDYENRRSSSRAKPEQVVCHEPVAEKKGKDCNPARISVCVTSFRQRLLDPDNLIPKYFLDGLRYSGLIHGDRADQIVLEVSQVKVKTKADERTEIEITPPESR